MVICPDLRPKPRTAVLARTSSNLLDWAHRMFQHPVGSTALSPWKLHEVLNAVPLIELLFIDLLLLHVDK
jgi:hypothetical protein